MASSTSTTTPTKHAFEYQCAGVRCPKEDLNALILDYLTMEGYKDAAAKFAKEANLPPLQAAIDVEKRQDIKRALHTGNVEAAIDGVNELDHGILEDDPALHFALLRLQLVELIRASIGGDISPALQFATKHLAPRAPVKPEYLADLEKTMALLILPHKDLDPSLAYLLDPKLRRDVADMLNQAITSRQHLRKEAAVRDLVRLRQWSEKVARKSKKDVPERLELNLVGDESEDPGHDPMVS